MRARGKLLLLCVLYWLAFFLGLRLVFLAWSGRQAVRLGMGTLLGTFGHGVRLDLAAAAYLCLIPFLLIALSVLPRLTHVAARLLVGYTILAAAALGFLGASDLGIFQAWGRRIDAAVLPYLSHPRETWASAGASSPWLLILLVVVLATLWGWIASRLLGRTARALPPAPRWGMVPLLFATALLFVPARGGIQQIPINQSSAYFSADPFANQAAINVAWNFFDSWIKGVNRRENPYVVMPMDSARALVADAGVVPPDSIANILAVPKPNILLIVWESFTARAVERLGGKAGVVPEFSALADTGLLFRRMYAAGDRTDKGLAAILSAQPTVPNASILMVPSKARSLPMLSRDLHAAGYRTAFYYGGELGFANLKGYVLEGQFDAIVGKDDFPAEAQTSKWGAHDAAVATRVEQDLATATEPFFATWLTLSSHEPFDVPGPVRIPGSDGESRFLNSLAYTDHVIGELVGKLRAAPWWNRTLVIIVADHSKKLEHTDADVPYKSAAAWYHIPMVWTGGALLARGTNDILQSQTDLAPTLLGMLGLTPQQPYSFGRNASGPMGGWAYYSFDDGFGLVTETGSIVWEHAPGRITSRTGTVQKREERLGQALLQLTVDDYLKR